MASGASDVGKLLTMQLGPEQALLVPEIKFHRGLSAAEFEAVIDRLKTRILEEEPTIRKVFVEPDALRTTGPLEKKGQRRVD